MSETPSSEGTAPGEDARLQELEAGFLEVALAAQEHFGEHDPSEEELLAFLRNRLLAEGKSPDEADAYLAEMGGDRS